MKARASRPSLSRLGRGLVAERLAQRIAGAASAYGIASGASDKAQPHVGARLAERAGGRKARELSIERREARMGINAQAEGELPPRRAASGDGRNRALLVRIGRLHGGFGAAENVTHPAERVANRPAWRGDEVLCSLHRFQRRPPRGAYRGFGSAHLLKLRRSRDLAGAHTQEVRALYDERPVFGIRLEGVLEVFEPDPVADPVVGAAQQFGPQHLARREGWWRLVLASGQRGVTRQD
jgi:hypothetical protein